MYSDSDFLKRILHQKSNIWYIDKVKRWELMSIVRTRQCTIVSIGNHEKGMEDAFLRPLTMRWNVYLKSLFFYDRPKREDDEYD